MTRPDPRNDRLLRALRLEPVDRTPVWFMRQAGRSLPTYRQMRADRGMFEILRDPPAAAEITRLPLDYYPVDALVLYNDLSTPFLGAGLEVEMRSGVGPVVDRPVTEPGDVDRLEPFDPREALPYTMEAVRLLAESEEVPVLGFAGAPFTLCSYLVHGPRSRRLKETKAFMWRHPEAWDRLLDFWARHLAEYAVAQHEAGASAVQIFDSWAGVLAPEDYRERVRPHSRTLFRRLEEAGVPSVHFTTGNPALLEDVAAAGGDAVAVDWRLPLDEAWERIGHDRAIQGNLDPTALLAGPELAVRKTRAVLERAGGRPGHIFNLGHGLGPDVDPAVIRAVVEEVHRHGAAREG